MKIYVKVVQNVLELPVGAIEGTVKNPHQINQEKCIKCEACLNSCPFKAISKE